MDLLVAMGVVLAVIFIGMAIYGGIFPDYDGNKKPDNIKEELNQRWKNFWPLIISASVMAILALIASAL